MQQAICLLWELDRCSKQQVVYNGAKRSARYKLLSNGAGIHMHMGNGTAYSQAK